MSDTIAAAATGGGISAVGIIRLSGDGAIETVDKVFRASSGVLMARACDRKLYYGLLTGISGEVIDMCLCTVSRGPGSYTGEDTAELHCHGSPTVMAEALKALFHSGARQAEAGEFTKRAFLNGKMDLTQAEAVIDLIEAETPAAAVNAAGQLGGVVGRKLDELYGSLLDVMAHFHAVIDYPDEDIDDFELERYLGILKNADAELSRLYSTYERGRVLKDGVPAAIIGRPNTGKSSLLNALLGRDRAIVTGIAGTTRDTIEEKIFFGGIPLRIIDTAGIRKTDDEVERLGVERSLEALREASLALIVLDSSMPLQNEDFEVIGAVPDEIPRIAVLNKSDLPLAADTGALQMPVCHVSAITGTGLDSLEDAVKNALPALPEVSAGEVITNARQAGAIFRALESVRSASEALLDAVTPDAVLTEIETALSAIGEITGKTIREDITARIFERFCVGK